eukprot:m.218615 g.218615  ORF g.218615 m.218615 type:complete len:255 (+) comp33272_c1_seq2:70-834(+)
MSTTENEIRTDLVVAHWLTGHYGMDELMWNHISARLPTDPDHKRQTYLVSPGTRHFMDIEEKDLAIVNVGGPNSHLEKFNVTGDVIHSAIYAARPDVGAIVHTHSPAVLAVSCLKQGLQCYDQSSAPVYGNVAYYDWQGVSTSHDEGPMLSAAATNDKMVLMMRNHGACTFGANVGEAWVRMFFLERACRLQLELMKSGGEISRPSEALLTANALTVAPNTEYVPGAYEWEPMKLFAQRQRRQQHPQLQTQSKL